MIRILLGFMFCLTISAVSCDQSEPGFEIDPDFDIQGHRGARGVLPENSLAGFIHAMNVGATTLEMDLAVSLDSQLVVSHEPYFSSDICSHPDGNHVEEDEELGLNMFEMSFESIEQFDCGSRGNSDFPDQVGQASSKPLLSAVIDSVEAYAIAEGFELPDYNIEIKSKPSWDGVYHPDPEAFATLLIDLLQEKEIISRSIIQSFDVRALQETRELNDDVRIALLVGNEDGLQSNLNELGFTPDIYSPLFTLAGDYLIAQARERNMLIIPWTINDSDLIDAYIKLGVDGIITDYPQRLKEIVDSYD